jgi:hypothetical protein
MAELVGQADVNKAYGFAIFMGLVGAPCGAAYLGRRQHDSLHKQLRNLLMN